MSDDDNETEIRVLRDDVARLTNALAAEREAHEAELAALRGHKEELLFDIERLARRDLVAVQIEKFIRDRAIATRPRDSHGARARWADANYIAHRWLGVAWEDMEAAIPPLSEEELAAEAEDAERLAAEERDRRDEEHLAAEERDQFIGDRLGGPNGRPITGFCDKCGAPTCEAMGRDVCSVDGCDGKARPT